MDNSLFKEYEFKFYLNASHSVIFNGKQGDVHPHTWEMIINIRVRRNDLRQFGVYEKAIEGFFAQYQDKTLNECHPFDSVMPILENIVDYSGEQLRQIIENVDGQLLKISGSETPTRSYIVSYTDTDEFAEKSNRKSKEALNDFVDYVLDNILAE